MHIFDLILRSGSRSQTEQVEGSAKHGGFLTKKGDVGVVIESSVERVGLLSKRGIKMKGQRSLS